MHLMGAIACLLQRWYCLEDMGAYAEALHAWAQFRLKSGVHDGLDLQQAQQLALGLWLQLAMAWG